MKTRYLKEAKINGMSFELVHDSDCKNPGYWIIDDACEESFGTDELDAAQSDEEAKAAFDKWVDEQRDGEEEPEPEPEPDWELQAEYDEMHGTINGQDPGVVMMNELWGD